MKAIGLMSGTSLDGITVALIESELNGENLKILFTKTYPYGKKIRNTIKEVSEGGVVGEISNLHYKLGKLYSKAIFRFLKDFKIDKDEIEVVGLHGQTIYHENGVSTFQIGEPSFIAVEHHLDVVSNFRAKDIALSGIGAPLVPFFDYLVFKRYAPVVLQNLGGISNLTFIRDENIENVVAFDTGPCNMLLDNATQALFGKAYDKDGILSSYGKINERLFKYLKQHPFLKKHPPKSAGRNEFGNKYLETLLLKFSDVSKYDFLATLNYFVAYAIKDAYERFLGEIPPLIVLSGGGAKNKTLVSNLKNLLKNSSVKFSDEFGILSEGKEAAAFALYALRTKYRLPCGIPKTTGSLKQSIWGCITYGE